MRHALALAVIAVAWSSALFVHQRNVTVWVPAKTAASSGYPGRAIYLGTLAPTQAHPSWEDPAAVLVALGGLAVAFGIGFNNTRTKGT
jgi:hypothetical protein